MHKWTIAKNDIEWSKKVREKYRGNCAIPNCSDRFGLGAHHIIGRGYHDMRLVVENGIYLCAKHHNLFHKRSDSWKKKMLELLIGKKIYLALMEKHQKYLNSLHSENIKKKQLMK